jgi:hypothetical protein
MCRPGQPLDLEIHAPPQIESSRAADRGLLNERAGCSAHDRLAHPRETFRRPRQGHTQTSQPPRLVSWERAPEITKSHARICRQPHLALRVNRSKARSSILMKRGPMGPVTIRMYSGGRAGPPQVPFLHASSPRKRRSTRRGAMERAGVGARPAGSLRAVLRAG